MDEMEIMQRLFDKTIPISMEKLYIELTNRCNLKCAHCYNNSNEGVCIDLPLAQVIEMLRLIQKCNLTSVALSGGEALLYPYIDEVLEACKQFGLEIVLLTNGTYIRDDHYWELIMKYLPEIQVSLDGPNAQSNDKIRGIGSFDQTISFVKKLKKAKYPKQIMVNTVLTEYTVDNYQEMVDLCYQLGIDKLTYSLITSSGRAQKNKMRLRDEDFYRIVKDINTNIRSDTHMNCQGVGMNHTCSLTNVNNNVIYLQPKVTCQGHVFPCQMHQKNEYIIGNVHSESLEDILNGDSARRFLALMYLRKTYMKECTDCLFRIQCGRGCMAKAVNDYNNPFAADGCCTFYKEWLLEELKHGLQLHKSV